MRISASAEASIARLLENALRDNSRHGDDQCIVTWQDGQASSQEDKRPRHLIVLNLATYLFRIVSMFEFDADRATAEHMAKRNPGAKQLLEGQQLLDVMSEFANVVCGEVNRGLNQKFPHAGLSTPILLENSCADYLSVLAPARIWCADVAVNDSMRYTMTACLCVDGQSSLDFDLEDVQGPEVSAGELELF